MYMRAHIGTVPNLTLHQLLTVGTVPFFICCMQGYTQEQLDKEENVESIQLNVQYQPTATLKVR